MLPLSDVNPTRRFPIATVILIVANVLVFVVFELPAMGSEREFTRLLLDWAVIPSQVTQGFSPEVAFDIFRAMFMHGGWTHLLGNMLYLWIFGDNLEDRLGIPLYLGFYFVSGVAATLAQVLVEPASSVPMVGASGAIAGVLGGYLLLFPGARVRSVIFFGYFIRFAEISAAWVLGLWFALQLFNGVASVGMMVGGGVAFFAHIGGFLTGLVLIWAYRRIVPQPEPLYPPQVVEHRPTYRQRDRDPNDPYDKYGF